MGRAAIIAIRAPRLWPWKVRHDHPPYWLARSITCALGSCPRALCCCHRSGCPAWHGRAFLMAPEFGPSNCGDGAGIVPRAYARASSSFVSIPNERQKAVSILGSASRPLPHIRFQIGGFSSPCRRPVLFSLPRGTGHTHPVERCGDARGVFYSARVGCRLPVQALPDQHISQCLADRVHLSLRLSCSPSLDGSKLSGRLLRIGQKTRSGSAKND